MTKQELIKQYGLKHTKYKVAFSVGVNQLTTVHRCIYQDADGVMYTFYRGDLHKLLNIRHWEDAPQYGSNCIATLDVGVLEWSSYISGMG